MVPLEAEVPDDDAWGTSRRVTLPAFETAAAGEEAKNGAAAPISVLSKLGLKEAVLELEAVMRGTRDASSAAVLQLWQSVEKRLGLEVGIEDPAIRGLFGLHIVAVEELFARVQANSQATLRAIEIWSQPLGATATGLQLLSDSECGDGSALGEAVGSDLAEAGQDTSSARLRSIARIQKEVQGPMEARLRTHAAVREDVRERQKWHASATAAMKDVAWLRKGAPGGSGLRALNGRSSVGALEQANARQREAMTQVSEHDERLLSQLLELQGDSMEAVRAPWAALVQIQSEFFVAHQAIWVPLADAFREYSVAPADQDAEAATENTFGKEADCYY